MIRPALIIASLALAGCGSSDSPSQEAEEDANASGICSPVTCANHLCGSIPDGCGAQLECGTCTDPKVCVADGAASQCETPCLSMQSVFFDLGETLVTANRAGGFTERPSVEPLLEALAGRGLQLGVVTTVPSTWTESDLREALPRPELLDAFDVVLLSSQASSPPKPSPAIFAEANGLLPIPHDIARSIFVTEELGDIADRELQPTLGARAAGMLTIHLSNSAPSPWADFTLAPNDLNSISSIVDSACAQPQQ